jgi:hypothetical protein
LTSLTKALLQLQGLFLEKFLQKRYTIGKEGIMQKNYTTYARWATSLIALVLLVLGFGIHRAVAQTNDGAVSLGVSPQILDLTANPGETIENIFRLTNASPEEVDIVTTPKNFTPRGEEGAVDLTVDNTNFSLAQWINVTPSTVKIAPGQTQDFAVEIVVPNEAEPGSHFGSVVFQTIPPEQEGSAALVSQEIAPVILVKIAGETTETAEIVEFKTEKSSYSNEDSFTFLSRLENTGNVHFKPTGKIVIKNMLGDEVSELELDQRNVLPDSIRQITSEWQPEGFQFGRYTATLTMVYGENDEIRTAETSFIVFPYQVILPVIIVVLFITFILIKFRKRLQLALKVLSGKEKSNSEK